ncbi:MAG: tRNA uridine-5-carboxymethylaminomethyl(34) synthesis enzyme MnmG [Phycisphaerales bacterium]|nr:tRNA uridine-5-carboxymethylaminomethyl(34) synthesis enzyme MnmG [Phycisphaerales bacterium]
MDQDYQVIVIGGGHAGLEAAWAAANLLGGASSVALVTIATSKVGMLSCNPAIGGLAKGQLVREVDAMGGFMGLVADATGIQFKVLNTSKGAAVHGQRCQSDKAAYARVAQDLIGSRPEIDLVEGTVEQILTTEGAPRRAVGIRIATRDGERDLLAPSLVLTTGTFMRGLMHTGEDQQPGGRRGEAAAYGISACLQELGFELGRLRTGTPPRLRVSTIDTDALELEFGDQEPTPFSELTPGGWSAGETNCARFPLLEQVGCWQSRTSEEAHELIRANLDRAPMYSGNLAQGPRYCPSIEDKVVRFRERESHGVYLEPESLESDWIYCNGIATSLPADIQDEIVKRMPGCENAEILQHGYAVEYDMVRPHQILTTGEARGVRNLFLAGQINGTSGYEEAAAQGLVAGINAAMLARDGADGYEPFSFGRDLAYIGVLMDDLVTKTPREPYRMFTSRAEHRLILRGDNAPDRLTPVAKRLGLLEHSTLGRERWERHTQRTQKLEEGRALMRRLKDGEKTIEQRMLEPGFTVHDLRESLAPHLGEQPRGVWLTLHSEARYAPYIERQRREIERSAELEHRPLPDWMDYAALDSMRTEAKVALEKYRPTTFGQASRLEGITPSDITLLSVLVKRARAERAGQAS